MYFSFVHKFSAVDVKFIGVIDKQMALLLYLQLSFLEEINMSGFLTLLVDGLISLAFVD